ncbi:MAG: SprT family zinc-dependent metalloprotease [Rubrivivax sp.]
MPAPPAVPPPAQLSLFDEAGHTPPEPAAPQPGSTAAAPVPAPADLPTRPPATRAGSVPVDTAVPWRAPPHARHAVLLSGHRIAYELQRARRRSIGFSIGPEGLAVRAPRGVGTAEIESVLQARADWILRKLHEQRERARRQLAARVDWREGAHIPFLGEAVVLVLDPRLTGAVLQADATGLPGVPRRTLHLGLPHDAVPERIRDTVQGWLQRQARRLFEERCAHFAPRLGVHVRRLALSSATTRWGSASADGSVRLNWRLVHFGLPVIDYVVAHELSHFREMNHSPAFWSVVRSVLPGYEQARTHLRDGVVPVFD